MSELYTSTLKYFRLAIREFLPQLNELRDTTKNSDQKEKLEDMIEAYNDIAKKIDGYHLNLEDPNRFYDGEPSDIEFNISDKMIEELARLSVRLLNAWKNKLDKLEKKVYITDENKETIYKLKNLIWPLEALTKEQSYVLGKYSKIGPLEFPGEIEEKEPGIKDMEIIPAIFSEEVMSKIPKDVATLCREFNFNFKNHNPHGCMLLLRRMLPLSIVRKFQSLTRDSELKNQDREYFGTEKMLDISNDVIQDKRIYRELKNYKSLLDGSQHSFSLNIDFTDTQGVGLVMRKFLDDIF